MILFSLLLAACAADDWVIPARELAELGSREAMLQLPGEPYELVSGSFETTQAGPASDRLFLCEQDSILCRLELEPPGGLLEVRKGDGSEVVRSVSAAELYSPAERFSNTQPVSVGRPLLLRAGESLHWKRAAAGKAHWVLRLPSTLPGPASSSALQRARELFSAPPQLPDGTLAFQYSLSQNDPAGSLTCVDDKRARGPACVSSIVLRVDGPAAEENARFLFVRMSFDGQETVVAPLPALFRCVELDPRVRARSGRDYALRWKMPYREKVDFLIENLGPPTTHVSGALHIEPWNWDERSLHFSATWLKAAETRSVRVDGCGVLLGIAPALATRDTREIALRADDREVRLRSGILRLDRLPFRERLEFTIQPDSQTLLLLGLRPGAKVPLRAAVPDDWESLSGQR
jgi:hypothetical protein